MPKSVKTDKKQKSHLFQPGESGNPAGRPKGSRHKATLAAEILLQGEAEALTRKAVELALQGDRIALRLCLERIVPPIKERPLQIKLPAARSIAGVNRSIDAVLKALANGDLLPGEANAVLNVLREKRQVLETIDIEKRLTELEKNFEKSSKKN